MIELAIVIVVGGLILSIVGRAIGDVQRRLAADQAMKSFETLHARARAHAIERGTNALLTIDTGGDSVSLVVGGQRVETLHFRPELGVDMWSTASANPVRVCMTPRGYGDTSCMSYNATIRVFFGSGKDTTSVQLLPLGQLKR